MFFGIQIRMFLIVISGHRVLWPNQNDQRRKKHHHHQRSIEQIEDLHVKCTCILVFFFFFGSRFLQSCFLSLLLFLLWSGHTILSKNLVWLVFFLFLVVLWLTTTTTCWYNVWQVCWQENSYFCFLISTFVEGRRR